ncbi:MAG: SAM-dependent methyltransferase [Deltaproteobacteria bacterium]|nr:SAM-dependent methyltransferase [Deltaproteobacteria bacterium]
MVHLKAKTITVAEREAIQHNVMGWEYKPLPYLLANTNLILHDINLPDIKFADSLERPLDINTIIESGYNLDIKNPHQPEEEEQYSSVKLLDMLHQSFGKSDELLASLRKELG